MRGSLGASDRLQEVLGLIADSRMKEENIFVPEGTKSAEIAWDFNGTVKFINECTRDELLYICQVLCQKMQSSANSESLPSAA